MRESLEGKIARVTAEEVQIVDYDPNWVKLFEQEKKHLLDILPGELVVRIEHFGSTSVPGLCAKPIVDMIIEINDVECGKTLIPEILEPEGCDCFWRPLGNENVPPYYTWCIVRDSKGRRTHHFHCVEPGFKDNDLRFRDILREHPDVAREYGELKQKLATRHHEDRITYTEAKGEFIKNVLKRYCGL